MKENIIYFAVGFKSYEIERYTSSAEEWFEWTERGRNLIRRTTFSRKMMMWLCDNLKEASRVKGNYVKRWKSKDQFSETFCARNYNRFGRYITIIRVQGRGRSVIIVPEVTFNSGWMDIAIKIERFINSGARRNVYNAPKVVEEGLLYSNTVRNHKWANREMNAAETQQEGDIIRITGEQTHNGLLGRCLVGIFPEGTSEMATLSEVRKWTSNSWKQVKGTNIYEMDQNRF
ncbi:hypothetical protein A4A49_65172, partial [Nicotiana attenuata]